MGQIKGIVYIPIILLIVASHHSCSDDFLSGYDADWEYLSDSIFLTSYDDYVVSSLKIPVNKNTDFTIRKFPRWLSFESVHGEVKNGEMTLSFRILKEKIPTLFYFSQADILLDIKDYGIVSIFVSYIDYGTPTLQCPPSPITFEANYYQTFTIGNTTHGILLWEIDQIPDWLSVSERSGTLYYGNIIEIRATIDPATITPGLELSGVIHIRSNSVSGDCTIGVQVRFPDIIPPDNNKINGIVTDAEYNQDSGILAICTRLPNRLILLNTNSGETDTIGLNNVPTCISISDDGQMALIGYSVPLVSRLDLNLKTITANYVLDCIPYDIEVGDNGWCYINPSSDYFVYLRNFNLNTGELVITNSNVPFHGKTNIRKVPGKPYLIASRIGLEPDGLIIADISGGVAGDTVTYHHMPIGYFWIKKDGTKLYTGYHKHVYYMPEYSIQSNPAPPSLFGTLPSVFYSVSVFDECPATNSIFVTFSSYIRSPGHSAVIDQFDADNLTLINSFSVSPAYFIEGGLLKEFEMSPYYFFVNKDGSTLFTIKNLFQKYEKDYWAFETIQVNDPDS